MKNIILMTLVWLFSLTVFSATCFNCEKGVRVCLGEESLKMSFLNPQEELIEGYAIKKTSSNGRFIIYHLNPGWMSYRLLLDKTNTGLTRVSADEGHDSLTTKYQCSRE